ncbi:predicted protein [Arabidopsis lyrata subsp. lyrata]|uniref:Predicted protein n=1 Tax=Arabidopsis lyrata subsp. lyrata TaxID=81972 RepID=D7LID1_ARALL|nr:predicted protein [Arabidopsis lyrata subsp. lyrata]
MTKKRSKLRNRNSTSDPENDSPRGSRSSSYREIPCRDSSSIIINRVSSGFDGYIFGSLSRPPENCSVLLQRCNFTDVNELRRLRMIAPPYDGSSTDFHVTKNGVMVQHLSLFVKQEACCFEFHSYVSAHMRLMEQRSPSIDVMEVMLLSCLTKVNSFSSKWLDLHVIIGSQSCVSRHEKIWSRLATLIHEAVCIFAGKGFCFMQELFGWLKCFLFVVIGCSITEFHNDVVFALCATHELLMTQSLLQPLLNWFKSSKRLALGNVLEFGSCLQKLQQLMSCGCPRHVVTLTGLLFQLLASRVQILYISFGDPLILLMPRVIIVGCGRVQIFAAEVFALNATHEMKLTQSLP